MLKKNTKVKESRYLVRLTDIYIFLLITVFLLCFDTGGYTSIVDVKFHAFCIISGGYVLLMLVLWIEMLITGQAKCPSIKTSLKNSSWVQRLVFSYALFTIISAILSPYGTSTILGQSRYEGALTIVIYVLCFLLVSVYGRVQKWQIYVLAISISIFSILSIIQLAGLNPFGLYPAGYTYYDGNIAYSGAFIGTIGNIDLSAIVLCVSIPILLYSIIRLKEKQRYFLIVPLFLCTIVLIKINVAAGILGACCGFVITFPRILKISPKTNY